jgi:hypothetical protein
MRKFLSAVLSAGLIGAATVPAAADSYTTRIEPRPYYGATVTIESGVRVFRAIPPTRHMIINPHGSTPLNLGINDTRVIEKSTSHNYFYDEGSASGAAYPVGTGAFVGGFGGRHGNRGLRGRKANGSGPFISRSRGHRGGVRGGGRGRGGMGNGKH